MSKLTVTLESTSHEELAGSLRRLAEKLAPSTHKNGVETPTPKKGRTAHTEEDGQTEMDLTEETETETETEDELENLGATETEITDRDLKVAFSNFLKKDAKNKKKAHAILEKLDVKEIVKIPQAKRATVLKHLGA